jgi:hypothetical protein
MPEGAVYVGRPTKWGNPFVVGSGAFVNGVEVEITPELAVGLYREVVTMWWDGSSRRKAVELLGGHDLVCWCSLDQPCHADVLLEIANASA